MASWAMCIELEGRLGTSAVWAFVATIQWRASKAKLRTH